MFEISIIMGILFGLIVLEIYFSLSHSERDEHTDRQFYAVMMIALFGAIFSWVYVLVTLI